MTTTKAPGVSIKHIAKTLAKCTPLFQALGEPARQQIILMLAETEELNVSEIAGRMDLSRPAISHHLKVLRAADLVSARREGTENFYRLTMDDALLLLARFVAEVEACEPEAE
jgi:ArsR family transcriptional regulator, arsenate/arsenite/antimonite-responsive transcriptional repressor